MASYRLIDEYPDNRTRRAPFSPLGLFFLTVLFLPAAAPFWVVNWGRLGQPDKRLITALAAIGAFGVPLILVALGQRDVQTMRLLGSLLKFAFAYFQLFGQRPLYDRHLMSGGAKAAAWPLWLVAVVSLSGQFIWILATQNARTR